MTRGSRADGASCWRTTARRGAGWRWGVRRDRWTRVHQRCGSAVRRWSPDLPVDLGDCNFAATGNEVRRDTKVGLFWELTTRARRQRDAIHSRSAARRRLAAAHFRVLRIAPKLTPLTSVAGERRIGVLSPRSVLWNFYGARGRYAVQLEVGNSQRHARHRTIEVGRQAATGGWFCRFDLVYVRATVIAKAGTPISRSSRLANRQRPHYRRDGHCKTITCRSHRAFSRIGVPYSCRRQRGLERIAKAGQ